MRIWSLHPQHLDRMGLLACWRETLLAQAVLAERTRGYRNHPQLERFRAHPRPLDAVGAYLSGVAEEAGRRGYRFDAARILRPGSLADDDRIPVTEGQLAFEWQHLGRKLRERDPDRAAAWEVSEPVPHPVFCVEPGSVASWERP
ncbi:pyrimidine dimer DNA glycosylase/endonuclease V [Leucobacter tenebrionis]|uniref:pyrimidine dimer DNA glycosylase/endonuclease V n=1 Tax=Leucobacter tenebrionis TaxID=2873270 RepID=UPI001CA6B493|nr:pyrimidine dimer DNA glycosylase/endonuclease V [Leucobacter tenebrionis]QZY51092.1 pyrimidine dimer DNA glycosylase/endonuclease V [Leucobacter tenebrionis]